MHTVRLIVLTVLLASWTGAVAQKVAFTAPASLDTYARDEEYVSIINEGVEDMKGTLTLVLDGGQAPIPLDEITLLRDTALRHRLTFPDTLKLRRNLLHSRPMYEGRDNLFRGHVQLVSTGKKTGTDGKSIPVSFVNTIPITIYGFSHLLLFSNLWVLIWVPPLLTLLLLLIAWMRSGRRHMTDTVAVKQLLPDPTYVTNFSLFGALAASGASLLTLDAPNKVTAGLVGALSVALLALAPLLFTLRQRDTIIKTPTLGSTFKGYFRLFTGEIKLHPVLETKDTPSKEASVRWYLLVMALTLYGASLAMTLALLVLPRTIDVYRSANVAGVILLDYALRGTLMVISVAFILFSYRIVKESLKQKRARLV